jgi:CubicO group peptidase (beta-lactamase class C family)
MNPFLALSKLLDIGLVGTIAIAASGIASSSAALLFLRPAQAEPVPAVTQQQVQAALVKLDKLAEQTLKRTGVPGIAIAVVYKDQVVYLKGFGVREAGKNESVDANTVFQLASMSKPIASTIVAALVSDGLVGWDDHVIDHDSKFQMYDPWVNHEVTIRDFFSHRSGLSGNAGNDLEELGYGRDQILDRLRYLQPTSSFRSTYAYSNFGITEGAIAAAKATGKPWEEVAVEKLYKPLGMTSTSSRHEDFVAQKNRAHLHILVNGKWTPKFTRDADAQSPAGGVSSNARDLTQWMRLQLANGKFDGKPLISEDALAQTHLPLILRGPSPVTGKPTFYGLGWGIDYDGQGRVLWGHAGAFSLGARTVVNLIPSEELGIVVLANAFPTGVPEGIANTFFDLVHEGKPSQDWLAVWNKLYDQLAAGFVAASTVYANPPELPAPALPPTAYVGTYANDYVGNIEIKKKEGKLVIQEGPQKKIFPLTHYDRDLFIYYPAEEAPKAPSGVTFTIGPDQKASQVVIDDLNDDGQGIFTRVPAKK